MFWLVLYFKLFVIRRFVSLIYLKAINNEIYEITTTLIDLGFNFKLCILYLFIVMCTELWGNDFSYNKFSIQKIFFKEENRRVL